MFRFERLGPSHDRARFQCGESALDRYFQTQVTQDVRRRAANCFVGIDEASGDLAGFYTLSSTGVPLAELPAGETKHLPRYPTVPAVLLGRLAVDLRFRRRGLGEALLMDAVRRAMQDAAAACMMLVDAKDETSSAFYARFGFRKFGDRRMTMFLMFAKLKSTLLP